MRKKKNMISEYTKKFHQTRNPYYIFIALLLIVRQGRLLEVLYGYYCSIFHRSSEIMLVKDDTIREILAEFYKKWNGTRLQYTRNQIIDEFGKEYLVQSLPLDFVGARRDTIIIKEGLLIIGEYGDGVRVSRIAVISSDDCKINSFYTKNARIIHIHAIHLCDSSSNLLITTGDSAKVLDKWDFRDGDLTFVMRLKKHFAGYTAIAQIKKKLFFGSDFSGRPNYIETIDGKKFFFPEKALNLFVLAFFIISDRYIASVNVPVIGERWVISIFDTQSESFIYCDYLKR